MVFGGTDLTALYTGNPDQLRIMTSALHAATTVVAFSTAMEETALKVWPFLAGKVEVVPQAISVPDLLDLLPPDNAADAGFVPGKHIVAVPVPGVKGGGADADVYRAGSHSDVLESIGSSSISNACAGVDSGDYASLDWTRGL